MSWLNPRASPCKEIKDCPLSHDLSSPIELALLERRFGIERTRDMLKLFLTEMSTSLTQMKELILQQRGEELAEISHLVKGACTMMLAKEMLKLSAQMEEIGMQGDWESALVILDKAEAAFERLKFCVDKL